MDGDVGLKIGLNVNIQRTDGRIHSAVISSINVDNKSVTVEWFEKGETKGKEVEFDAIYNLNPELETNGSNCAPSKKIENLHTLHEIQSVENGSHSASARKFAPKQSVAFPYKEGSMRLKQNNRVTQQPSSRNDYMDASYPSETPNAPPAAPPSPIGPLQPLQKVTLPTSRRRSNVVKEVDKIKKQREERRARQAEKKAEQMELMNLDPGNPNWEFLGMIREYCSQLEYRPLTLNDLMQRLQICVAVRKRPMNRKENLRKEVDVITVPNKELIIVHEPKQKVDLTKYLENQVFRFDYAFEENADNELVYRFTAKPLVQTIFEGGMATCFAYGQTGSGKTHTMGGDFMGKSQDCSKGIYALATREVFSLLSSQAYRNEGFTVSSSFFEIYSGKVFDLLNNKMKLRVLEDGKQQVQVVGLQERVVDSVDDVLKLIQHGNNIRTSGQTSANQHSSRSHAVFQIILKKRNSSRLHGKFSLIDLAGNERGADTSSANRQTRMEGAEINKSLLALKECIRALGRKGAHLPFRASKLTQVLRDSFIGENSRTCMIAMISPGMNSCEHSLNTLRYADRVKELGAESPETKSSPNGDDIINQNSDLALIRSSNEGELSEDMVSFHEAISHLQEMEEDILDTHKNVIEADQKWLSMDVELLSMSNNVDYDVDVYAQNLEDLIAEKLKMYEMYMKLKEKVTQFRQQLVEEEKISRTIKKGPHK